MSSKDNDPKKSSLLDQWKKRKATASSIKGLTVRPVDSKLVPSSGQKRLWLLQEIYPDNPFYQYAHLYHMEGALDRDLLVQSFQKVIDRHEILRSNYEKKEGDIFIKIQTNPDFNCAYTDLSQQTDSEQSTAAANIITSFTQQSFDLSNELLIRIHLIKLAKAKHTLALSIHHIVGDRESLLILNKEAFTTYKALQEGHTATLPELSIQYLDYSFWLKEQTTSQTTIDYWKNQLAGELPLLALPLDYPRPKKASFKGATIKHQLSKELSNQITALAKNLETTPYVLLLAAFKVLLFRYTRQTDLLVGSPFGNRDKVALEKLIGFFNETLILRSQLSPDWSFKTLVNQVKTNTLEALAHKKMPFDELVRVLQPERHGSANPIFQAMFLYNNMASDSYENLDLEIKESTYDLGVSKFDLTLFINEEKDHLSTAIEYSLDLFKGQTIQRLLLHFENILQGVVKDQSTSIATLPIMQADEIQTIITDWNNTKQPLPSYQSVHQLIEETAKKFPNKVAVVYQSEELTYAQLNQKADQIAHHILQNKILNEYPIGLYVDRSVHMIVGILGILKTGAAYLPLDPSYPSDRIQYMIEDAEVSLVLSQKKGVDQLNFGLKHLYVIEDILNQSKTPTQTLPEVTNEQMAYLIYTSGSTGKPKGVPISHGNLLHSTLARFSFYPTNPEAFLLLSSFSFDSSIVGLFWTLCSGGTLVLPPQRIEQDVQLLSDLITKHRVTHTLLLPSLYGMILKHAPVEQLQSLQNVMVAGEACPFSLIDLHFTKVPNSELYNEYGPTEASVWCVAHRIEANEKEFVPIGKAIPNTTAYILDAQFQAVPIGVFGELYIGGAGLSSGYLNRPALTAARFLPHPFIEGARIYKTGDLARFHEDGQIEFLGRADQQIKIRGFRVEPGEIQKVITNHELVDEALVVVHRNEHQQQQLIAYISTSEKIEPGALNLFLKQQLPAYMVPGITIPLTDFPRLPNGKIDRKKLPQPSQQSTTVVSNYEAPKSNLEIQLAEIWETTLKVKQISRTANFFSIGGDSILSIQIVSKARDAGINLAPNQLFEHQTIAELANSIEQSDLTKKVEPTTPIEINNPDRYPLSYLQNAFLFNSQIQEKDQGQLLLEFTLQGSIEPQLLQQAWQISAQEHEAMRAYVVTESGQAPTQVIAAKTTLNWEFLDWSNQTEDQQKIALNQLKQSQENKKIDLSHLPTSRLFLLKINEQKHILIWVCHHIFLDGWSCGIILKDVLTHYKNLSAGQKSSPSKLPNYPAFLAWKEAQDVGPAQAFWQKKLAGFEKPLLFSNIQNIANRDHQFKDDFLTLSTEESLAIRDYCQKNQVTLSSLFQGIWALLLGQYFQTSDVVYGLTVSGRFTPFQNIESISGLFMNVLPSRFEIKAEHLLNDWLRQLQKDQSRINAFDSYELDQIKQTIDWPHHTELFDSLFVFGNFLKDGLSIGGLSVETFTGGFSSNFPLTIRVNPTKNIAVNWRYDQGRVSKATIDWFKNSFVQLSKKIPTSTALDSIQKISNGLWTIPEESHQTTIIKRVADPLKEKVIATIKNASIVGNSTEVTLTKIWQKLFDNSTIKLHDNFFELGGRSLMAIQLFAEIEQQLGQVLPPSTLLKHATIASIAQLINQSDETKNSDSSVLVPLRATGSRPPLFCLHGGGAHVFFYQGLAKHLPADQPVYSLQPPGLDGISERHQSIEAMASHYIQEIKKVQVNGPYQILGTCFSNAVALEMGNQLITSGEEIGHLFIIDSAPVHLFGDDKNGGTKTFARFYDMLKRGDFSRIGGKIMRRFGSSKSKEPLEVKTPEEPASERNLRLTIESLNELYAKYHWQPFTGKIHFIRSSEFQKRSDKKYHLTQWKQLAQGGLDVHVVPGHHTTLFEEPEVKGLSTKIATCIQTIF